MEHSNKSQVEAGEGMDRLRIRHQGDNEAEHHQGLRKRDRQAMHRRHTTGGQIPNESRSEPPKQVRIGA